MHRLLLIFFVCMVVCIIGRSQDSIKVSKEENIDKHFLKKLEKGNNNFEKKLDKNTTSALKQFQKQEQKLKKKIWKKDSVLAKQLFQDVDQQYANLQNVPTNTSKFRSVYSSKLDSLSTSLNFINSNSTLQSPALHSTLSQYQIIQEKLNQTDHIKKFVAARQKLLKQHLDKLGMVKELKAFQKEAYYFSTQIKVYNKLWEDPSTLEAKLLELVRRQPDFKSFFANNSLLGSIFRLPGADPSSGSTTGLQTRAVLNQQLASRFGAGTSAQRMLTQNLQSAQGELMALKKKANSLTAGTIGNQKDLDLPDGFKPNNQKSKSFLQRLEYGLNIQTQKGRSFFPVTSDIGLSIGYKIDDHNRIGIGASYKLGWGRGWDNISLTHQGIGLRSFMDMKLKGSFFITGGYEQNYRSEFHSIDALKNYSAWQKSGLIGLSKRYSVSKKVKGDMKLLWDFLSYQQVPRTQPIVFRIGYTLK